MNVRQHLQRRGIWPHLQLVQNPRRRGKLLKPAILYMLSDEEFKVFTHTPEMVKMPQKYASDIGKLIQKKKFVGLKSHDYHVFMQQMMPLGLQGLLKPYPRMVVMRMYKVFCKICTKVYDPSDFQSLPLDVAKSMAILEMEFPPSCFDIMIHLPYHFLRELDLYSLATMRWMY